MKKQEGITLVALVITIIVLLILAMVSIKIALSGGLIEKTKEASDQHTIAVEKEAITTGYAAYQIDSIKIKSPTLSVDGAESIDQANWIIKFKKNKYKLYEDGRIELLETDSKAEKELQSFKENPNNYTHPEQSADNKDRAIGTDGKAVNLDLWLIRITDEANGEIALSNSNGSTGNGPAYASKQLENGKIKGTIPQYIYVESNKKVYTVTGLISTFVGLNITESPIIPTTVTNMKDTFTDCTKLIQAPTIPSSVTNMYGTFFRCTSLKQAPTIPNSVTDMMSTFSGCTSLTQAPDIPSSVKIMSYIFDGCTKLTGTVRINSTSIEKKSWESKIDCFTNITNNITVQVPANSTTYNTFNEAYGSSSNIKIETFE